MSLIEYLRARQKFKYLKLVENGKHYLLLEIIDNISKKCVAFEKVES